jgi:hypothetical protein
LIKSREDCGTITEIQSRSLNHMFVPWHTDTHTHTQQKKRSVSIFICGILIWRNLSVVMYQIRLGRPWWLINLRSVNASLSFNETKTLGSIMMFFVDTIRWMKLSMNVAAFVKFWIALFNNERSKLNNWKSINFDSLDWFFLSFRYQMSMRMWHDVAYLVRLYWRRSCCIWLKYCHNDCA